MNKAKVAALPDGILQRHVEIDDLKLVLDEGAAGLTVLAAPLDIVTFPRFSGHRIMRLGALPVRG